LDRNVGLGFTSFAGVEETSKKETDCVINALFTSQNRPEHW